MQLLEYTQDRYTLVITSLYTERACTQLLSMSIALVSEQAVRIDGPHRHLGLKKPQNFSANCHINQGTIYRGSLTRLLAWMSDAGRGAGMKVPVAPAV